MNIYRYKNANEDNQTVSIEFEYKEPIVFALEAPDEDYELLQDQIYMDNFVAEKYAINQTEGQLYKHLISAKVTNMVTNGTITAEQSQVYSLQTKEARDFLSEGYWHSAYYALIGVATITTLSTLNNESLEYIKNYVNTKYPPIFFIQ